MFQLKKEEIIVEKAAHAIANQTPPVAKTVVEEPKIYTPASNTAAKPSDYGVTLGGIKRVKNIAKEKIDLASVEKSSIEISQENLEQAWSKVVHELTSERIIYRNAIKQGSIGFEGNIIRIYMFGVAYDFVKEARLKLLDYFKHHYQNEALNVVLVEKVPEVDSSNKNVLSTKEIFEKMVEQNPLLKTLKDKLGMDFEY